MQKTEKYKIFIYLEIKKTHKINGAYEVIIEIILK